MRETSDAVCRMPYAPSGTGLGCELDQLPPRLNLNLMRSRSLRCACSRSGHTAPISFLQLFFHHRQFIFHSLAFRPPSSPIPYLGLTKADYPLHPSTRWYDILCNSKLRDALRYLPIQRCVARRNRREAAISIESLARTGTRSPFAPCFNYLPQQRTVHL